MNKVDKLSQEINELRLRLYAVDDIEKSSIEMSNLKFEQRKEDVRNSIRVIIELKETYLEGYKDGSSILKTQKKKIATAERGDINAVPNCRLDRDHEEPAISSSEIYNPNKMKNDNNPQPNTGERQGGSQATAVRSEEVIGNIGKEAVASFPVGTQKLKKMKNDNTNNPKQKAR